MAEFELTWVSSGERGEGEWKGTSLEGLVVLMPILDQLW